MFFTVGPLFWSQDYDQCDLTHQSPIDITDDSLVYDEDLDAIEFINYDDVPESAVLTLENTGHFGRLCRRKEGRGGWRGGGRRNRRLEGRGKREEEGKEREGRGEREREGKWECVVGGGHSWIFQFSKFAYLPKCLFAKLLI